MTKRLGALSFGVALLMGGVIGFAVAQAPPKPQEGDDEGQSIQLADVPAPVRAALGKHTAEKNVKQVSKEIERGMTVYEFAYEADGKAGEVEISESGDVLEVETAIQVSALPKAASAAIAKAYPKGTIKEAEAIQAFFYEVVVTSDGKDRELTVTAGGQLDDDDNGEDDDDDEDDEEDDD